MYIYKKIKMKQAALSWLKLPVRFPARNDSNGRGLSICLQCGLFAFRIRKGFAYLIQKALLNNSSTASVSSTTECRSPRPSSSRAPYSLAAPSFTAPSQALAIVWKFALPHSSIIGASIPCLCSTWCGRLLCGLFEHINVLPPNSPLGSFAYPA